MRLLKNASFQVLLAIAAGIVVGLRWPQFALRLEPLSQTFIHMIKMVIAPVVFLTIVIGIAGMGNLKKVGRVGAKALLYFELVTTLALVIGLCVANLVKPGAGMDTTAVVAQNAGAAATYVAEGKAFSWVSFFTHIVPQNVVGAFAEGNIVQVLFFSILFGIGLARLGPAGESVLALFDKLAKALFGILAIVMRLAPVGAFGGMAYSIGKFGARSLLPMGKLMLSVYATMFIFVFVVLNAISRAYGFSLWRLLKWIRQELLIVLGTASSESVLAQMIDKLERFGCSRSVVGLVVPAGYSFNPDGTSIYLSMASLFIAQAFQIDLSLGQQLTIVGILMVTSKGVAAVTGGGFIVLASTLTATRVLPPEGLVLLLGVDRFMSESRALVNVIGYGVATVVIAKSENEFDEARYRALAEVTPPLDGSLERTI